VASHKKPPLYWVFETGFIQDLPWDPGEWHWQASHPLRDAPLFGYTAKRGYKNARRMTHAPNILTFIQGLNLQNSTTPQARIWHNARPKKVGTFIWLTLNQGLLVGTWLQLMGIPPIAKFVTEELKNLPSTTCSSAPWCNVLGKLIRKFGKTRKRLKISPSPGHSSYLGRLSPNERTTPPDSSHTMPATSPTPCNLSQPYFG